MKESLKKIGITVLIAIIISAISLMAKFYIEQQISNAVAIKTEELQNEHINMNRITIYKLKSSVDTTTVIINNLKSQQEKALNDLKSQQEKALNDISTQINNLTYVIRKNNTAMKKDLEYIKNIQNIQYDFGVR